MVNPKNKPQEYSVDAKMNNDSFSDVEEEESNNPNSIWNHCILEEFPIISVNSNDEKAICSIGFPHAGLILEVDVKDGNFHGTAVIRDGDDFVYAMFEYCKGEATGTCKLYYNTGEIFFSGYLKKGYRNGRGQEFDKEGNIVFDGFFRNGYKMIGCTEMPEAKNYWKEVGKDDKVVSICKKNERGENEGICYFYSNGELERISEWHNNTEVRVLYTFNGNIMTEFINDVKRYQGNYKQKPWMKIVREGKGTWYDKDGTTVIYCGEFKRGLYHGEGNYSKGKIKLGGDWMFGMSKTILWILYSSVWVFYIVFFYLWALVFNTPICLFLVVTVIFDIIILSAPMIIIFC